MENLVARNSWERQLGESDKAYKAFILYRDAGLDRTLKDVAAMLNKSVQNISRWSIRWEWRDRVEAWDSHVEEIEQRETFKERVEYRKLSLQIAKDLATKAALGVQALKTVRADADGRECLAVKPTDLIRMLELSYKIQGELLGKANEDQVAKIEVHFGSTEDEEE
jgi:membrane-bound lytic murein transglycosylase